MTIEVDLIPGAFETRVGLPRPNWPLILDWVTANVLESDLNIAWTEIARQWMKNLLNSLPGGYHLSESDEFVLLSRSNDSTPERILDWCESFREAILDKLQGVARDDGFGKHIVLAFEDQATYYDYIADFYPEDGDFATSGGVFLNEGYSHFVFWTKGYFELERTIAHELTHSLLSHLPLPLWLNEGITLLLEDVLVGTSSFGVDGGIVQRHRSYWTNGAIDSFWSGESFDSPDEGQELSYHLAEVLVRNLSTDYPRKLLDFLSVADSVDAGETAARKTFGVSLQDRVAQFLGPGDWRSRDNYGSIESDECD